MSNDLFAVTLLRTSADGFAGIAASRMFEDGDTAELESREDGFEEWKGHLRGQVLALAAAVEDAEPQRFVSYVAWSRDAFLARSLPAEGLRAGLGELRVVLQDSLPEPAWEAVREYLTGADQELSNPSSNPSAGLTDSDPNAKLALRFVSAVRAGDEPGALSLLSDEVEAGRMSVGTVLERVLAPAMHEVGRLWHVGQLTVAEEHFASVTSRKTIARLVDLAGRPAAKDRTAVVTMVAGDAHDIGANLVAAFFELDGWRAICLGADTPDQDLAMFLENVDADVLALGATLDVHRNAAASAIRAVRTVRPSLPILVGGPAFGEERTWRRVGADAFAPSATRAVELANQLAAS